MDEELRKRLIDAIASGKEKAIRETLSEVKGKTIRVRSFLDMMKYEAIYTDPNTDVKVIWDLEPNLKEVLENSLERKQHDNE